MAFAPQELWLDQSALPELVWARLYSGIDGWFVLDSDGKLGLFDSREEAVAWLVEDEYVPFGELVADGEVPADAAPPASFGWPKRN